MTINTDLSLLKKPIRCVISNRFTFGVPLEDIFPASDIHPQLKNLFGVICQNLNTCDVKSLYHILRYEPGSKLEKDQTIESLELCKDIDQLHIGLLFWGSRSFLECLPIPVLPTYTNGQFFNWNLLAKSCSGDSLSNQHKHIFMQIIKNLLRLPVVNFILLDYFFNLLRKLSIREGLLKQNINKKMLVLLVKYYAMALFEQRISFFQKEDVNYSPLLYYLVINWKIINYFIKQHKLSPTISAQNKENIKLLEPINKSTQTLSIQRHTLETIFDDEILENTSIDVQINHTEDKATQDNLDVPIKASTFINSQCQTDDCEDLNITKIKLMDESTQFESDVENDVYYTPAKHEVNKMRNSYTEIPTKYKDSKPKHTITDKLHCLQSSECSHLSQEEDPYIYDDYCEQMLITTVSNDSLDMNDTDVFLSLDNTKEEQDKNRENIKSKVTKLGWTYTPSLGETKCPSKVNVFSPRPFTTGSAQNLPEYKLCFESEDKNKSKLNEEKAETIKTVPTKSLRDIISSGSMKVKLEFLRILGKRRDLKMKSNSSEEVASKIKYKKMDSTRSNMF